MIQQDDVDLQRSHRAGVTSILFSAFVLTIHYEIICVCVPLRQPNLLKHKEKISGKLLMNKSKILSMSKNFFPLPTGVCSFKCVTMLQRNGTRTVDAVLEKTNRRCR